MCIPNPTLTTVDIHTIPLIFALTTVDILTFTPSWVGS